MAQALVPQRAVRENLAAPRDFLAGAGDPISTGPVPFLPVAGSRFTVRQRMVRQRFGSARSGVRGSRFTVRGPVADQVGPVTP